MTKLNSSYLFKSLYGLGTRAIAWMLEEHKKEQFFLVTWPDSFYTKNEFSCSETVTGKELLQLRGRGAF